MNFDLWPVIYTFADAGTSAIQSANGGGTHYVIIDMKAKFNHNVKNDTPDK